MAWARVATGNIIAAATSDANANTNTFDSTGTTFMVAEGSCFSAAPSINADSKGNTWNELTGISKRSRASGGYLSLFWCIPTTVGSGHFLTFLGGGARYPSGEVVCFTGNHATPFGAESGFDSGTASSIVPGELTPSEDNMLLIVGLSAYQLTAGYSIDAGWTQFGSVSVAGQHVSGGIAFQIQTTATARNPSQAWTSGLAVCAANIASFKVAAAGAAASVRPSRMPLMGVS